MSTSQNDPLTFARLRELNVQRCTAPDGFNHGLDAWSLLEWVGALSGEVGEAAGICKDVLRHQHGVPGGRPLGCAARQELADELADVLCYLDLLAAAADIDLAKAVRDKFDRVSERVGWPGPKL